MSLPPETRAFIADYYAAVKTVLAPESDQLDAIAALEQRVLDLEQRDRTRIVVRWPRSIPVDGDVLTKLRDVAFDQVVVEL